MNVTLFGSQTWKNILNTLPIIFDRIVWSPGTGNAIIIGRNVISGLNEASFLLEEPIRELNKKHIFFLFQASRPSSLSLLGQNWIMSNELNLEGDLGFEWEKYKNLFLHAGIVLKEHPDELK